MPGIDIVKNWCRKRIKSHKIFDRRSFRIKKINKDTQIVIACPKGKYNPKNKRCSIGTKIQSIRKRRKKSGICPKI